MLSPYLEDVKKAIFAEELRCHRKGWDENQLEVFGVVADGEDGPLGPVWSKPRLNAIPLPPEIHRGGAGVSAKIEYVAKQIARSYSASARLREHKANHHQLDSAGGLPRAFARGSRTDGYVRGFAMSSEGGGLDERLKVKGRLYADTVGAFESRDVCAVDMSGEVLWVHRKRGSTPVFRRTHVAYDRVGMPKALWAMVLAGGAVVRWSPPNRADHPDMDAYLEKFAKEEGSS